MAPEPSLYGHFGQGCVHTPTSPWPHRVPNGVAPEVPTDSSSVAARLVASYGGSFSGEHGDGQSRGELLPIMFGDVIIGAFAELKAIFDPQSKMNPGKVVTPARLDEHLRLGGDWAPHYRGETHFSYPDDGGSFVMAANRCVGVGKCRQHGHKDGSVMCPSYQATMDEEHSPRGRSRLLFEMLDGHGDSTIRDGWHSEAILGALDLCLACKGCKSDCPVNVDIATYKAEFLAHHYEGRIRPRAHYALGWLPAIASLLRRLHLVAAHQRARTPAPSSSTRDPHRRSRPARDPDLRASVSPAMVDETKPRTDRGTRQGDALGRHLHEPVPPCYR